jgi:hypothetical protein
MDTWRKNCWSSLAYSCGFLSHLWMESSKMMGILQVYQESLALYILFVMSFSRGIEQASSKPFFLIFFSYGSHHES